MLGKAAEAQEMREKAKQRLIEIGEANGGRLTPEMVLSDAADTESPLHEYFEWDDTKAAHAHRIDQARTLIRSVRVHITVESRKVSTVFYVRDPAQPYDEQGYVSIPKLRTDEELAREALVSEFARAGAALDRAHRIAAALNLQDEVQEVSERVRQLSERVAATAQ